MATNRTFDSQDDLINQAAEQLKWDEVAKESMYHDIPVQVIPLSLPNLPGLPHIGTVTHTKRMNGKQHIYLTNCSVQGKVINQNLHFTYDQLDSVTLANMKTPDSSLSFSIIPMEDSNAYIQETQQSMSPERSSTPITWADAVSYTHLTLPTIYSV